MQAALERVGIHTVHHADTASAALAAVRRRSGLRALALIGAIPDQSVVTLTRTLVSDHDWAVVALLSARDMGRVVSVLQAGASAVLERDGRSLELGEAIAAARAGRRHLSPGMLDGFVRPGPTDPVQIALTPREREVLDGIVAGRTNAEIAARLAISDETVKTHVTRVFQKLGVRRRSEAVGVAIRLRLV